MTQDPDGAERPDVAAADTDGGSGDAGGSKRYIFVTGAASGIGRATALLFARAGWSVAAFDRDAAGLAALDAAMLQIGDGDGHMLRPLDVTDRSAVLATMDAYGDWSGGRLDLLFNNAGIIVRGPFADMAWEQVRAIIDVNLIGGLAIVHAGLPLLRRTPGSLCMSTSSASAIFGSEDLAIYSATKHAVKGFTEALSLELARDGVRAADVLPGIIDTAMLPGEMRPLLPAEGHWRLIPPEAVAQAVWDAYHGTTLHSYVPPELQDVDVRITRDPDAARDQLVAGRLL